MNSSDKIRSFRDLLVWQKAMNLVTKIYLITNALPKNELYGITSQIRRCAVSIPSNIAEGFGRSTAKDYIRFLQIARGSLFEIQTQLEICLNLNYFDRGSVEKPINEANEIGKMLNGLIRSLKQNENT